MLNRITLGLIFAASILSLTVQAEDSLGPRGPFVTVAPIPLAAITRGKPETVELQFRVRPGFHINSNRPSSKVLIPTALRLTPPTDVVIGRIAYPEAQEMSFPFAPDDKLSVYTGDFSVSVVVRPLVHMQAGKYAVHGQLKYQACDNAACYPPKLLPVNFDIQVLKNPVAPRRNPAQSPHVHQ